MKTQLSAIGRNAIAAAAAVTMLSVSSTAFAKDSLSITVTNETGSPVIVRNGEAVGTIQLFYVVNALQFPSGEIATFDLDWLTIASPKSPTNYGAGVTFELVQDQQGGNVRFGMTPDSFILTGAGQAGTSHVSVSIANDKDGNPPSAADGTTLVGNLKLDAGSKVGSVTSVQVHIVLAHPTNCLNVYNFVTDQEMSLGILNTTNLKVPTNGAKAGMVNSSQPGQFSDNVLVSNVCSEPESFDLRVVLDSSFTTNPAGNPGNAVHAYSASGEFDPSNFGALLSATSTAHQQNLCLQNVTVAPGASLLVTVHSALKSGLAASSLPQGPDPEFQFWALLYDTPNGSCSGDLEPFANANPAHFPLPFTINN